MKVRVKKKTHQYFIDEQVADYSVTEILHKQGIAPSYDNVSQEDMLKARNRGNKIHKDIDKTFRVANYMPSTKEGKWFFKWYKDNCQCGCSEQLIGIRIGGVYIGGCIDFMGFDNDGNYFIADHKTTSTFQEEYVSWQVSIYDYMLRKAGNTPINGINFHWDGAKKFYCFWYKDGSEPKVKELHKIDDAEIEKLFNCVVDGTSYQRPALVIDKNLATQVQEIENIIIQKQNEIKALKEQQEQVESQLLECFEKQGIKTWETPDKRMQVTYVAPSETTTVDSTRLRRELPMIWGKYTKINKRKAYLKITLRDDE